MLELTQDEIKFIKKRHRLYKEVVPLVKQKKSLRLRSTGNIEEDSKVRVGLSKEIKAKRKEILGEE